MVNVTDVNCLSKKTVRLPAGRGRHGTATHPWRRRRRRRTTEKTGSAGGPTTSACSARRPDQHSAGSISCASCVCACALRVRRTKFSAVDFDFSKIVKFFRRRLLVKNNFFFFHRNYLVVPFMRTRTFAGKIYIFFLPNVRD